LVRGVRTRPMTAPEMTLASIKKSPCECAGIVRVCRSKL
jgi:hypothetical protein